MAWLKLQEGVSTNVKWLAIARRCRVKVPTVLALWVTCLDHASRSEDRGSVASMDLETIEVFFGLRAGVAHEVLQVMAEKGLLVGDRIAHWEKYQPDRDGGGGKSNAQRQREHRARSRAPEVTAGNGDVTEGNGEVTESNGHVTESNGQITEGNGEVTESNGQVTESNGGNDIKIKIKRREEEILNTPPYPPEGGGLVESAHAPSDSLVRGGGKVKGRGGASRHPSREGPRDVGDAVERYTRHQGLRAALLAFRDMRQRMRRPLTLRGLELTLRELDKLAANEDERQAIVEQSIQRGWQGVFPLAQARSSPGEERRQMAMALLKHFDQEDGANGVSPAHGLVALTGNG